MPKLSETAAKIKRRHLLGMIAGTLLFTACSNTENFSIHIAATGTKIEARQVVALVYAQSPDTEINQLLYSGGDLNRVIKQLRDRYPQLKPWLDQGAIGNTASGFMALRDTTQEASLHELLRDENRDRTFLYHQASAAVGHGGDTLNSWLPYTSYAFGKEWIVQGQPGWWSMNDQKQWEQN